MPLYECSACHAVENTALTNFWWDHKMHEKPALCSECDPQIGKWHGHFEKITVEEYLKRYPKARIEFLVPKGETLPPCEICMKAPCDCPSKQLDRIDRIIAEAKKGELQ